MLKTPFVLGKRMLNKHRDDTKTNRVIQTQFHKNIQCYKNTKHINTINNKCNLSDSIIKKNLSDRMLMLYLLI